MLHELMCVQKLGFTFSRKIFSPSAAIRKNAQSEYSTGYRLFIPVAIIIHIQNSDTSKFFEIRQYIMFNLEHQLSGCDFTDIYIYIYSEALFSIRYNEKNYICSRQWNIFLLRTKMPPNNNLVFETYYKTDL